MSPEFTYLCGGHDYYPLSDPTWSDAHKKWALEIIVCRAWMLDPMQAMAFGIYPSFDDQNVRLSS